MKVGKLRWFMIALVTLGLVTNYLARNTLSVSAANIMKDTGMTTQEYSYVVIAWQVCYGIMQPIAGWIIDILGTKMGLAIFAFAWSLACMCAALATNWQGLAFFRGLLGITEAAGLPAGVKTSTEWFPAKERSVAIGWMNIGSSFGAMLAPPIVVAAMMFGGWQMGFVAVGILGIIWSIMWVMFFKSPSKHPALSVEERDYILSGQEQPGDSQEMANQIDRKTVWKNIFRNRNIYSIGIARILTEPAWQTFNAWIPLYLMTQRGMDIKEIAMFAWLPFLAADIGCVLGGYLSPIFMKYCNVSMEKSRKMVMMFGALCMIGPACISLVASPYTAIFLLCIGGFAHQTLSGAMYAIVSDSFNKTEVATATGLGGMLGQMGAAIFTLLFGLLVTQIGYGPLFVMLACFDIVAAIIIWITVKQIYAAYSNTSVR